MLSPVFTLYRDERFVFFSGPRSDNGYLSNWYDARFSLDSHDFENSEQAFLYLKALRSGDEATAMRVFAMTEPSYFARLSRQIRPFDARTWATRREPTMRKVVHEKFLQNEELCDALLATGDATIVSCTGSLLWGCGLRMDQPERLDPTQWVGQNLLGTILMELREELRPPEPQPEPEPEPEPVPQPEPVQSEDEAVAEGPAEASAPEPAPASPEPEPPTPAPQEADGAAMSGAAGASPAPAPTEPAPGDGQDAPVPVEEVLPAPAPEPAPEEPAEPVEGEADSTRELPTVSERATTVQAPPEDATPEEQPSEEGLDPIVRRYEEGHLPTASELSDGSVLKHLMRTFSQTDTPEVRSALMQCLRDSVVVVPANKVDPLVAATAPVGDDRPADPLVMDDGRTYRPNVLENANGDRWFPAFSSADEVDEQVSAHATLLTLPMSQCVELARTHGGLAGIVVNVFSENLILPGRTCDYIAGLPSGREE